MKSQHKPATGRRPKTNGTDNITTAPSSNSESLAQELSPFFQLPLKLRERVYELTFWQEYPSKWRAQIYEPKSCPKTARTAILRVNRAIYQEAQKVLYSTRILDSLPLTLNDQAVPRVLKSLEGRQHLLRNITLVSSFRHARLCHVDSITARRRRIPHDKWLATTTAVQKVRVMVLTYESAEMGLAQAARRTYEEVGPWLRVVARREGGRDAAVNKVVIERLSNGKIYEPRLLARFRELLAERFPQSDS